MSKSPTNLRTLPRTKDTRQESRPIRILFPAIESPSGLQGLVPALRTRIALSFGPLLQAPAISTAEIQCRRCIRRGRPAPIERHVGRLAGSLFKLVLLNERCLNGPLGSIEPDSFPKQAWARGEVIGLIDGEHRKRVLALAIY
jgi:hypothetical protein